MSLKLTINALENLHKAIEEDGGILPSRLFALEGLIADLAEAERRKEPVNTTKAPFSRGNAYCEWFTCKGCQGAITVVSSLGKPKCCPNCGREIEWV